MGLIRNLNRVQIVRIHNRRRSMIKTVLTVGLALAASSALGAGFCQPCYTCMPPPPISHLTPVTCAGGCANVCDCALPQYRFWYVPGPELTGNYAIPYLYSPDTDQRYADPVYYHAQRVASGWNRQQGNGRRATTGLAEPPSVQAQMKVVTSRKIPAAPRAAKVVRKEYRTEVHPAEKSRRMVEETFEK